MLTQLKMSLPVIVAGAAIAVAPVASATSMFPAGGPPGCYDPAGTGCAVAPAPAGVAGPQGAAGTIPGGPAGAAGAGTIPGGPAGAAG
ncbi:hypothetical protein H7I41_12690, partial [Mycobacterium manitobense]|nr:hypothetical protein [[Mycobacterium] manitobense]